MKNILLKEFGFNEVEIKKIDGYDNLKYNIIANSKIYIFKTYSYLEETTDLVEAENEVLLFLKLNDKVSFPTPIPFLDGSFIKTFTIQDEKLICRMLSYLEGDFLGNVKHTKELFQSFGHSLAQIDIELKSFKNYTIAAVQKEWDIQHLHLNRKYIGAINNPKDRSIVQYFFFTI